MDDWMFPTPTEKDMLESTINYMSENLNTLLVLLHEVLVDGFFYVDGFCVCCGAPETEEHAEGCSYDLAWKEWNSYQPPDTEYEPY